MQYCTLFELFMSVDLGLETIKTKMKCGIGFNEIQNE